MSKSFTGLAVMQLVEAGKLDLDTPVRAYLPDFRVADETASGQITPRHLLHHTSGIPSWSIAGDGANLKAHVAALADAPSSATPGECHAYASPNYQVLGLLVETLSGQSFGAYVQRHIFTPLGMTGSHTAPPKGADAGVMACGHRYWFGFPRQTTLPDEPGRLPAAALISSAQDTSALCSTPAMARRGRCSHPADSSSRWSRGTGADAVAREPWSWSRWSAGHGVDFGQAKQEASGQVDEHPPGQVWDSANHLRPVLA